MQQTFLWSGAGAVVALLLLAALNLVQVPEARLRPTWDQAERGARGVALADLDSAGGEALKGALALKDPTPLFLPTNLNSGQVDAFMRGDPAPGTSFGAIAAKWEFDEDSVSLDLPAVVKIPANALRALDDIDTSVAYGELSRKEGNRPRLASRTGHLEVRSIDSGHTLYAADLNLGPAVTAISAPVELILIIDANGRSVRPTAMVAPESAPGEFSEITSVVAAARLEVFLRPGIYRILLGP